MPNPGTLVCCLQLKSGKGNSSSGGDTVSSEALMLNFPA
jgi:hypothetical protein